ncbi:hypothetical protein VN12_19545 [Pirellula sp. SH-Sr6A]|uniref:hypothetical protein n=1 Tax=Pirellula sp. SH-Sr6A TaxID=1632865 RepID=UPI00078DF0DA|nr:hypothetical protein [Pirellula sp. SH-Sr6A]AMV34329.1 hypothetical protein VN12_19545 [Pirellula sp. SH-Sr6A]
MPRLKMKRVFAAKIETAAGTAESLTTSDAQFNAYNIESPQPNFDVQSRPGQGAFGKRASVVAGKIGVISFVHDWEWDGTSTLPKWVDTLFPACGLVKSTLTFTPRTEAPGANVKTLTIATYIDGKLKKLRGASGTAVTEFPTNKTPFTTFTFTGIWVPVEDEALIAPTYPTVSKMFYKNSTTTLDGVALCSSSLSLDFGNTVTPHECQADVEGYAYGLILDRTPVLSGDPEAVLVATQDRYGMFESMAEEAFSMTIPGPTTSYVTIAAPKAQIVSIQEGDRGGVETDDIQLQFNQNGSTPDQEFSIVFTPAA